MLVQVRRRSFCVRPCGAIGQRVRLLIERFLVRVQARACFFVFEFKILSLNLTFDQQTANSTAGMQADTSDPAQQAAALISADKRRANTHPSRSTRTAYKRYT